MGSYSGIPELMHLLLTSWFFAGHTFFVRLLNGLGSFRRVRIDLGSGVGMGLALSICSFVQ